MNKVYIVWAMGNEDPFVICATKEVAWLYAGVLEGQGLVSYVEGSEVVEEFYEELLK